MLGNSEWPFAPRKDQVRVLTLIDVGSEANGGKSGGKLAEGVMRIQNSR